MPRARIHESNEARLRANAEARRAAGVIRKSLDLDAADHAALVAIREALGLDSDTAAVKLALHETAKKLARQRKYPLTRAIDMATKTLTATEISARRAAYAEMVEREVKTRQSEIRAAYADMEEAFPGTDYSTGREQQLRQAREEIEASYGL